MLVRYDKEVLLIVKGEESSYTAFNIIVMLMAAGDIQKNIVGPLEAQEMFEAVSCNINCFNPSHEEIESFAFEHGSTNTSNLLHYILAWRQENLTSGHCLMFKISNAELLKYILDNGVEFVRPVEVGAK